MPEDREQMEGPLGAQSSTHSRGHFPQSGGELPPRLASLRGKAKPKRMGPGLNKVLGSQESRSGREEGDLGDESRSAHSF